MLPSIQQIESAFRKKFKRKNFEKINYAFKSAPFHFLAICDLFCETFKKGSRFQILTNSTTNCCCLLIEVRID